MAVFRDGVITAGSSGSHRDGSVHVNSYVTTSDATATVLFSVPLAQLEGVVIEGKVAGFKSDLTAGIFRHIACGFRRASGGNVTSVGTASGTDVEDSAGIPAVTVAADTTNQLATIKVAGIASENWKWEGHFTYTKVA